MTSIQGEQRPAQRGGEGGRGNFRLWDTQRKAPEDAIDGLILKTIVLEKLQRREF